MNVRVGLWGKLSTEEFMLLNCGVGEDSWESFGLQRDPTSPSYRKSVLNIHWKDWCWSWNSKTLATWCQELTHWKRPWCWERLKAGGEGDDRGWDGWMTSLTQWTWIWASSEKWWRTGKHGVLLQFMGSQNVGHDWATEPNCQLLFPVPSTLYLALLYVYSFITGSGSPFQYFCLQKCIFWKYIFQKIHFWKIDVVFLFLLHTFILLDFPGGSVVKNPPASARRHRFDPWIGLIPWRRKWQPTPVFLPGESCGQRTLVGYSL